MDPYNILNEDPENNNTSNSYELKKLLYLGILFICVILAGYLMVQINKQPAQTTNSNNNQITSNINPNQDTLADANDYFGYNLSKALNKQDSNTFISPTSISTIFDLTASGAKDNTQKEILDTFGQSKFNIEDVNQFNFNLITEYKNNTSVNISLANSIFIDKTMSILDSFKTIAIKKYLSQVETLDFKQASSADKINDWVSANTSNKIPEIIDSQTLAQLNLALINAIYFKADWTYQFEKNSTVKQDFFVNDSNKVSVDMMHQTESFNYFEDNNLQLLELPYKNSDFSMYIFLPTKGKSIDEFINKLNIQEINQLMVKKEMHEIELALPKFKLEYEKELTNDLKNLGISNAFDSDKANFENLSPDPLFIDLVKHKSYLNVDELGTEAAAATIIGMKTTAIDMPDKPIKMIIDRPFFMTIRDNKNSINLFTGIIKNPTK